MAPKNPGSNPYNSFTMRNPINKIMINKMICLIRLLKLAMLIKMLLVDSCWLLVTANIVDN
jgi:hypothetical protein